MMNCILCFNESPDGSIPWYPPKLPELCCKYLHSSLTQEMSRLGNPNSAPFCPKCLRTIVELQDLNDQFEFYQKRISELVFILSLEILHRRGKHPVISKDRLKYTKPERELTEFDVSALPNCDFNRDTFGISEEIETSPEECNNLNWEDVHEEELSDPLFIPSTHNKNTDDVSIENVKVDIDEQIGLETEDVTNATEYMNTTDNIEKTDRSFSTGHTRTKSPNPILIQKMNLRNSDRKVIFIDSDQYINCSSNSTISASENCPINNSEENPYNSEGCRKQFKAKEYSLKQAIIHTRERPYRCDVCNKRFKLKHHLLSHKMIHSGKRPYKCDICGLRFTLQGSLNAHNRVHTGEQPYKCEVCGKRFAKQYNLRQHKTIHTGEKPYKCEDCGKKFRIKHYLEVHKNVHS